MKVKGILSKRNIPLLIERIFRLINGLFIGVLIARHIGAESYGDFALILYLFTIFSQISNFGVDVIAVRDSTKLIKSNYVTFLSTGLVKFIAGITVFFGIISYSNLIENKISELLFLISFFFLFQFLETFGVVLQSREKFKSFAFARIISLVLSIALKIGGVITNQDIGYFILMIVVEFLLMYVFYFFAILSHRDFFNIYRNISFFSFPIILTNAKKLVIECWPNIITLVCFLLYSRMDFIFANVFLVGGLIGVYGLMIRIESALMSIFSTLFISNLPALSYRFGKDISSFNAEYLNLQRLTMVLTSFFALLFYFLFPYMAKFIFSLGDEYFNEIQIMSAYFLNMIVASYGHNQGIWITNHEKLFDSMLITLIGLAFSLLVLYFLGLSFGLEGLIYGMLFVNLIVRVVLPRIYFKELRKIPII